MNPRIKYGLGAAALVAVATFQVISVLGDDQAPAQPPAPTAQPSVTVAPETPDEPTIEEGPADLGTALDKPLIVAVAKAYGEFSHTDTKPYAWMDRYAPLCTEDYAASLPSAFPFTKVDEVDWKINVVAPKAEGRVVNVRKKVLGGTEEEGEVSYLVTFNREIRYERPNLRAVDHDGGAPVPAKAGEWIAAGEASYAVVFVQEDGLWKVNHQERYSAPTEVHEHSGDHD